MKLKKGDNDNYCMHSKGLSNQLGFTIMHMSVAENFENLQKYALIQHLLLAYFILT